MQTQATVVNAVAVTSATAAAVAAQNDSAIAAPIATNAGAGFSLNSIVAERKAWEVGAYRTSNQQLYAILAKCLTFYGQLSACTKKTDALRVSYDEFVTANSITFKDSTKLIHRVVKCVFFEPSVDSNAQRDRRRISAYSIVLRRAHDDKVLPVDLAAWLDTNGGIEQIRLNRGSALTAKVKAEQARVGVEASDRYIAVIESALLMQSFDSIDYDKTFVAVVVPRGDGKVEIRAIVKSAGAVNASLATLYGKDAAPPVVPVAGISDVEAVTA